MTKQEAGSLGGRATVRKHGTEYMRTIAKRGAAAFWNKYTVQPAGTSAWLIVERATGAIISRIGNLPPGVNFERRSTNEAQALSGL